MSSNNVDENIVDVDELFINVTNENKKVIIPKFCAAVFGFLPELTEEEDELVDLMNTLPLPYTIINESYYIDKSYRDTYYAYFSNQHFSKKPFSRRLSFVSGIIKMDDFFSEESTIQENIEKNFMGSCVINPLQNGAIGRTLFDPRYLIDNSKKPVYMRLSDFEIHILGKKFTVRAFPFRKQDQETMSCAEVTLLNIFEYFSNSFSDYRSVVPQEIIYTAQKHSHERVLPSQGLTAARMSRTLYEFGFSPCLYDVSSMGDYPDKQKEIKRWIYYYIESGIPLAIVLRPEKSNKVGHAIVCIGHGKKKGELVKEARRHKWIKWGTDDSFHPIINAADFYDEFVVVDDNSPVYQVRPFNALTKYDDMVVDSVAVPLYKRMFLGAPEAYDTVRTILAKKDFSVDLMAEGFLDKGESIVARLLMTSSHSLKRFRKDSLPVKFSKEVFVNIPMPRFVWVCELYREDDYNKETPLAFGEIILDATSTRNRGALSLIMIRYPGAMKFRDPYSDVFYIEEVFISEECEPPFNGLFPGFTHNLDEFS